MRYILAENITKMDMGTELLLTNSEEKVISLQSTSKTIFELAERGLSVDEMVVEMKKLYVISVENDLLKNDIIECIDSLTENDILTIKR